MASAEAWQIEVVRQMFIGTADDNYISGRAAYFEERDRDFWWMILHALEKYLKAILLLNGQSVKKFTHEILPLLEAVQVLDPRLTPPDYVRPSWLGPRRILDDVNHDFLKSIDNYGNPHNRYGTYSYVLSRDDILKADHYIFWARRFARPHRQTTVDGREIDWVAELVNSPQEWRQHIRAPVEDRADLPLDDRRRRPLAEANFAFFPREQGKIRLRGGHAYNAPIYNRLEALAHSVPGSEERRTQRAVLEWVLKNVRLDKADSRELRAQLDTYL